MTKPKSGVEALLAKSPITVGVLSNLVLGRREYISPVAGRVVEHVRTVCMLEGGPGQGKTSFVRSLTEWLVFRMPNGDLLSPHVYIESGPKLARPIHDVVNHDGVTYIEALLTKAQALAIRDAQNGIPTIIGIDELRAVPPGHGISQLLEPLAGDPRYATIRVIGMTNLPQHYDVPDPIANRANIMQRVGVGTPFEEMSAEPFIRELVHCKFSGKGELPLVEIPDSVPISMEIYEFVNHIMKLIGHSDHHINTALVSNRTIEWLTVNLCAADELCRIMNICDSIFDAEATDIMQAVVAIRYGRPFSIAFTQQIGESAFPLDKYLFTDDPSEPEEILKDERWYKANATILAVLLHTQAKGILKALPDNQISVLANKLLARTTRLEELIKREKNMKRQAFMQNLLRTLTAVMMVEPRVINYIFTTNNPALTAMLEKYYYRQEG